MAHRLSTIQMRVHIAWWLRWYLFGVVVTSRATGLQPDMAKVRWWIRRAVRVDAIEGRRRRRLV
jgi:hypothetical protein